MSMLTGDRNSTPATAPSSRISQVLSLTANVGWLGLQHVLENGGSGFFARRIVEPLLKTRRLHAVTGAPEFSMPAYVVYPLDREGDQVSRAVEIMHRLADAQANATAQTPRRDAARARGADRPANFVSVRPIAGIGIPRLSKWLGGFTSTATDSSRRAHDEHSFRSRRRAAQQRLRCDHCDRSRWPHHVLESRRGAEYSASQPGRRLASRSI